MVTPYENGRGCPKCRFAPNGCPSGCCVKPYYTRKGEGLTPERKAILREEAMIRYYSNKKVPEKQNKKQIPKVRPKQNVPCVENTHRFVVYVLSNLSLPGILKVGKSKHLKSRLGVLNTGVPTNYTVEGYVEFETNEGMDKGEKVAHKFLDNSRLSKKKEFFACSAGEAIHAINRAKDELEVVILT
jgi:hypothetical protein